LGQVLFALALAAPLAVYAQEFRGAISGTVTDPSGAPIAGAKITVTETRTSTKNQTVTENNGQYNVLFLLPGDYDVAVQAQGFKDYVRKALHVGAGEHPVISVQLQVGDAAQTVEVTADVPLVNAENASVGQAITTKEVEDFPLNGRSPLMLAQLAIGVVMSPFNSTSTVQQPYDRSNPFSIGGTPTQTSEMLLDGSPNATWDNRSAYTPPVDAVQEVRVKAFDTDTAFGHTNGGTINMVLKTGTNSLHGTMYEFNQPTYLTANNFFNNRNGLGNPVTHFNQYGLTAGGPVLIPKLFNGKNKLFWFISWENDVNSQPNTAFMSDPRRPSARATSPRFSRLTAPSSTIRTAESRAAAPLRAHLIQTTRSLRASSIPSPSSICSSILRRMSFPEARRLRVPTATTTTARPPGPPTTPIANSAASTTT
jgi:hypothetical protein